MLAESFFFILENLMRRPVYADGAPRVLTASPHVPFKR